MLIKPYLLLTLLDRWLFSLQAPISPAYHIAIPLDFGSPSKTPIYSISTTPPKPLIVSMIFVPSSFVTPSFITFGTLSANFLLSIKLRPSMLLTSLMILDLAAASNDINLSVKRDFSCGAGAASSSSTGAGAAAAAEPPEGAAKERSGMLRRDCRYG